MARAAVNTVFRCIHLWLRTQPDDDATDGHLLDRFVAHGDEAAFTVLVQRHGRLVHNVCLRILHNAHDAEDAFQATFLVLARKAGAIQKRHSLASWLYGVAYRVAVRAKARAASRSALESERVDMAQPDPSHEAAWRELQPLLDHELERLPEKYRAPLLLCYFEGKSNEEAARLLHWPIGTVQGRLARARELLRQRLQRRGAALSVGTVVACLAGQAMAAPLPSQQVHSTVAATMQFVAGKASVPGAISAGVLALTKGELHSMFITKLRILTAVVALAGLGTWASVTGYQAWAEQPGSSESAPVAVQNAPQPLRQTPQPAVKEAPKAEGFAGRWVVTVEVSGESGMFRLELTKEGDKWKGIARASKNKGGEVKDLRISGTKISFDVVDDEKECELSFNGELKDGTVSGALELLGEKGFVKGTWSMTRSD